MTDDHRWSNGTCGQREREKCQLHIICSKLSAKLFSLSYIWSLLWIYWVKSYKWPPLQLNRNVFILFHCLYRRLWELTNICSRPRYGLRAASSHKSPLRWKNSAHWILSWSSHSSSSSSTPKFPKCVRRKASWHNSGDEADSERAEPSWKGLLCSPRTCKNPSLVSDCLILHHVSDSNMGFILYNYLSRGNDCISSFQTDNSIWTQVIRFLGCGWYLSIICPVKRQQNGRRLFLAAAAWNSPPARL